jgi:hypothetical protein
MVMFRRLKKLDPRAEAILINRFVAGTGWDTVETLHLPKNLPKKRFTRPVS